MRSELIGRLHAIKLPVRLVLLQKLGDSHPLLLRPHELIAVDLVQALAEEALSVAPIGAPRRFKESLPATGMTRIRPVVGHPEDLPSSEDASCAARSGHEITLLRTRPKVSMCWAGRHSPFAAGVVRN